MSNWFLLSAVVVVLLGFALLLRRANELFSLRARGGRLTLQRGRLPPSLFAELSDIAARGALDRTEILAVSEGGAPRLSLRGEPSPALEQALRNVLGRYNLSQIRTGRLRASRSPLACVPRCR